MKAKRSRASKPVARKPSPQLTAAVPNLVHAGHDQEFGEMIALMHAWFGRMQTIRRFLAKALNLSSSEFAVVITLERSQETGLRIRNIADELHVAAANVTATVTKLERMGWVVKGPDEQDSRAISIQLTRKARDKMSAFADPLNAVNNTLFGGTKPAEFKAVIGLFRRLVDQYPSAVEVAKSISRRSAQRSVG